MKLFVGTVLLLSCSSLSLSLKCYQCGGEGGVECGPEVYGEVQECEGTEKCIIELQGDQWSRSCSEDTSEPEGCDSSNPTQGLKYVCTGDLCNQDMPQTCQEIEGGGDGKTQCYVCNSETQGQACDATHFGEPQGCESTPLCSVFNNGDKWTRTCAESSEPKGCRDGADGGKLWICEGSNCNKEMPDSCNSATLLRIPAVIMLAALLLALY